MGQRNQRSILTVNTGSSSLKAALYPADGEGRHEFSARADRIGTPGSTLRIADAQGTTLLERRDGLPDHAAAVRAVLAWVRDTLPHLQLVAAGHRLVHGGGRYSEPRLLSADLTDALRGMQPLAPDHLPQAITAMETVGHAYPELPQAACFDTAFHRHMPRVARMYALPRRLADAGVIRYGFHGLSYEYIMQELGALDAAAARGRVIIAHLGNGASMAAVREGIGVETTMGFTPTGGLVMGTRCGDLDPGVLLYLLQVEKLYPAELDEVVRKQSGPLGVSGSSADMRDLLAREAADSRAAEAVDLFCYQARKYVGMLATTLGGLDALIFTAGIGEAAAAIRWRICAGLEFLGIELDEGRNGAHEPIISRPGSPVTVRVMRTNEDSMIARHTRRVMAQGGAHDVSV